MNCKICGAPIVLSPSAAERAAKLGTGETAAYYTRLFDTHAACALAKRKADTSALCARIMGGAYSLNLAYLLRLN